MKKIICGFIICILIILSVPYIIGRYNVTYLSAKTTVMRNIFIAYKMLYEHKIKYGNLKISELNSTIEDNEHIILEMRRYNFMESISREEYMNVMLGRIIIPPVGAMPAELHLFLIDVESKDATKAAIVQKIKSELYLIQPEIIKNECYAAMRGNEEWFMILKVDIHK